MKAARWILITCLALIAACTGVATIEDTDRTAAAPIDQQPSDTSDLAGSAPFELPPAGDSELDLPSRHSPAEFDFPGLTIGPVGLEPPAEGTGGHGEDTGNAEEGDAVVCTRRITALEEAVGFEQNSAELVPESAHALELIARALERAIEVDLEGHSSTEGPADWNAQLSEARAESVMLALRELLPDHVVLRAVGRGEDDPLVYPDDTEELREQNRRVEIEARFAEEICSEDPEA